MTAVQALTKGFVRTNGSKRIILFAWFVNIMLALLVAVPMFNQLNTSIRDTAKEEGLVQRVDENWYRTFKHDHENSEIAKLLDVSVFGAGSFLHHLDGMIHGRVILGAGNILYDLLTAFTLRTESLDVLMLLALCSMLINTFLAGGLISAYAGDYPVRIGEFLMDGARYFGRFFRISLIALVAYYLLFSYGVSIADDFIKRMTSNESSEWVPFVYYQAKNVLVLFILSLCMMCVDYARIRLVLEDRYSAFSSLAAGIKFAFRHFLKTYPMFLLLCCIGLLLIIGYVFIERTLPQTNFWGILVLFIFQQLYTVGRMWLRTGFFASQTVFLQKTPVKVL